jgi:alkaline phosphatase
MKPSLTSSLTSSATTKRRLVPHGLTALFALSFLAGCGEGGFGGRNGVASEHDPNAIPKNVIVVVVDGMGFNTIDAASLWKQGTSRYQIEGAPGSVARIAQDTTPAWSFERFPIQLAMTTHTEVGEYDADAIWADFSASIGQEGVPTTVTGSAASATSLSSGVKTIDPRVGLDSHDEPVFHLARLAQTVGKASGTVTNVPFHHATPAGFLGHNENRNNYHELARELILESGATVIMGSGHPFYNDDGTRLENPRHFWIPADLWAAIEGGETGFTLIQTREDFLALASGPTPARVFGLTQTFNATQFNRTPTPLQRSFREGPPGLVNPAELPFETPLNPNVPTLGEMVAGALNVLEQASDEGFFLMVESGAGDWGGHWNLLGRTIEDMVDLESAMQVIVDWVETRSSWGETLVIVTSDHETGHLSGVGSGPGWTPLRSRGAGQLPEHAFYHIYHTNQLVPFFARGAGAAGLPALTEGRVDPVRGPYLDNTDLATWLFRRWGMEGGG